MISGLLQFRFLHHVKHALPPRPGSMLIRPAVVTLSQAQSTMRQARRC
jgi:hypothetical protein